MQAIGYFSITENRFFNPSSVKATDRKFINQD
jgi:hypothetical protein